MVFEQQVILDGERDYTQNAFDFAIKIPGNPFPDRAQLPDGTLGDIARVVSFFTPETRGPLAWEVYAVLEVSGFFKKNVRADEKISVVAP